MGSVPRLQRSPGGGNGSPLQYSCLKNPMDRGDWQATVCRAAKSWTRLKRHSMHKPGPSSASVVAQSLKNSPVMQETACSAGDTREASSLPGSGRSPGVVNGNPLQYSCLKNPMDRGAWWATVHRVAKSQAQLSNWTTTITTAERKENIKLP